MRREQDYFSRTISSEGGTVYVRLRPLGSELRDLTKRADVVNWFSILPGLISIMGWLAHHTAFRSGWRVTAEPDDAIGSVPLELDPMPKRDAEHTFLRLVQWLQDGHPLREFASRSA